MIEIAGEGVIHLALHDDNLPLELRSAVAEDAEAYVAYLERNWDRFRGAMPTADDALFAPETHRRRFSTLAAAVQHPRGIAMLLTERESPGRVVGDVTFSNIVFGAFQACHVGFKIDRDLEGRGLMRRALETCCDMMFARFGLHRIMANYRPDNVRSGALLKRAGFEIEGLARDYLHLDGKWRDHVLTSLVNPAAPRSDCR